jgi:hypothetical protein
MVEFGRSQNVAWPILRGAKRGSRDCRLAVASLAAAGRCMVEGLHLATVRICRRDYRGLAPDSTLDSLGNSVDHYGLPANSTDRRHFRQPAEPRQFSRNTTSCKMSASRTTQFNQEACSIFYFGFIAALAASFNFPVYSKPLVKLQMNVLRSDRHHYFPPSSSSSVAASATPTCSADSTSPRKTFRAGIPVILNLAANSGLSSTLTLTTVTLGLLRA